MKFNLKLAPFLILCLFAAVSVNAWQMKQPPLATGWTALVNTNHPLPEYPRPQLVRSNWLNLNGVWQFQPGATNDSAPIGQTLSSQILVPFPMESAISGVMQYYEFSWYRQLFTAPAAWTGKRIILHLDAVTWQATVYVNGTKVGIHKGGYDPFSYDITPYLNGGSNELLVQVYSPEDNGGQPRGKQTLYPGGIMYTSASGIWQPVWLEPVDASGIADLQIIPDVDNSQLRLTVNTYATSGVTVVATVLSNNVAVDTITGNPQTELDIPVPHPNLWSPENPFLYGLQISTIRNGVTNDTVASYFGMRKISVEFVNGIPRIYLNNQPYFQMGPLDQGYWPDGIYTAPTDAALEYDLLEEKALGYNAVRKHEKVERQRWYYWADTLGLVVWQDMPTCNSYTGNPNPPAVDPLDFIAELSSMVTNHWNSPSIIMWDIFNEDQGEAGSGDGVGQTNTAYLVQLVKGLDPSRLVNQASGGAYFGVGDVLDNHNYPPPGDPTSSTQAAVDGEYGGIGLLVPGHLWNPGQAFIGDILATNTVAFADIYDSYSDDIVGFKAGGLNAAIETQITDVENECDGLLTYDRAVIKPDPGQIKISNQKAITGQLTVTTVVPTSQTVPQTWQYTTLTPAANWYASNFDDSAWSTAKAGFGTADPGVTPNTAWTTTGYIYLRRTFNPGTLTAQQISELGFSVYHDEDVVIYINGVFAGSASGYSTSYINIPMTSQAQAAIIPNGTNILAVSCYQTTGGQFIDVGISDQVLVANAFIIPTDEIGYWPLDATNGTVAADATGNGNNGTVVGATWNTNGEVNGCLSFNGVNNYVQITNPVSGDFSIVTWVKTTQTAGAGQWYEGAGLVDGDSPGDANDFGTALIGGSFAFGVGNPNTTILSTTPINDGYWHQCVATRVQASGAISLYVDGNLEATGVGNENALNASAKLLFGAIGSGGGFFDGSLDEVRIYNRALGDNEVSALFHNGVFPPTPPIVVQGPVSQTVFVGESAAFSAVAIGGNLNYQWYLGATPIPGATNSTLTLTDVASTDAGNYIIFATNSAGSASSSATLTVLAPALQHRYSFTGDASDSVGGANGTLKGNATILSGALQLPGGAGSVASGSYLQLPPGMFLGDNSITVETWLTDKAGVARAEPWCIGGSTTAVTGGTGNNFIGLIPHSSAPDLRVAFNENGVEDDVIWANNPLPLNKEEYVALTYDSSSQTAAIYVNGVQVAASQNIPYTPASLGNTYDNFLGLDEYNDNLFQGSIDEFRIWNGTVTPLYLAISAVAGPNVVVTNTTPQGALTVAVAKNIIISETQQAAILGNFIQATNVPLPGGSAAWTSSNTNVVTVNNNGLVNALSGGTATVTATVNGVSGTSAVITVQATAPIPVTVPANLTEPLNGSAVFAVEVLGGGLSYQWSFDAIPIIGATNYTLTLTNLSSAAAGTYSVAVSNTIGATNLSATLTVVPAVLLHRYSFVSDASDSVGGPSWNGAIVPPAGGSAAAIANGLFLPGNTGGGYGVSGYVALPSGILTSTASITVECWVSQNQYNTWAEVWDFGNNGNENFALIPDPAFNRNNGQMAVAFTPNGNEVDLFTPTIFPDNSEQYVSVTFNSSTLAANLYTNGILNGSITLPDASYTPGAIGGAGGTTENMLGNDVYGDPQFSGAVYELRIWNGVVPPLYLALSAMAGPGIVVTNFTPLSIAVTATNLTMVAGSTQTPSVIGNFVNGTGVVITASVTNWTSSNPNVLMVDSNGVITALDSGTATISATVSGITGATQPITVPATAPVITNQLAPSESLLAGGTLSIDIGVVGNPPFVCRWFINNGAIPLSITATPTLTIPNLQLANAGSYTCLISNRYGSVLSSPLNLTVISPNTYQLSILSLGPIAYWPLSETSGSVAHDLVGNNNGTYIGGCTLAQSGPTNSIFGSASRSALFDGASGYVDIPEGPFNLTNAITTVAWVNLVSAPSFAGLLGHGDVSWRMSIDSSSQPGANDGTSPDATSSNGINDGNWHVVAYVYTGVPGITGNGSLYVDGALAANNTVAATPAGDNLDVWIGGSPDYGAGRLLNAKIAHAAVFDRALTAVQIQDLHTGVYAAPVNLTVTRSGSSVMLNWPEGVLLQAPSVLGPWTTNSAAVSPYTVPDKSGNQFFRVLVNSY